MAPRVLSQRLQREENLEGTNLRIFVPGILGLDTIVRELNDLEPGLVKQLRKDMVTEIKPLYSLVRRAVESKEPFIRGFDHSGRTGARKPIKVTGRAVTTRRKFNRTSLVSIRTTSAAVQIADMAGRGGARGRTEAGQALIARLSAKYGAASRFIYPAIEREIPRVQQSIIKILEKYTDMVNRKLIMIRED